MSTRSQIAIYQTSKAAKALTKPYALIYRHSDGYPGTPDGKQYGVLADIIPFLARFDKFRGLNDEEYLAARLLHSLCNSQEASTNSFNPKTLVDHPEWGFTGYGISQDWHGDIEYAYAIDCQAKKVLVYDVSPGYGDRKSWDPKDGKFSLNQTLIQTVDILTGEVINHTP